MAIGVTVVPYTLSPLMYTHTHTHTHTHTLTLHDPYLISEAIRATIVPNTPPPPPPPLRNTHTRTSPPTHAPTHPPTHTHTEVKVWEGVPLSFYEWKEASNTRASEQTKSHPGAAVVCVLWCAFFLFPLCCVFRYVPHTRPWWFVMQAYSKAGLHIGSQPAMVTVVVTCSRHSHPHGDYDSHSSCDCHR